VCNDVRSLRVSRFSEITDTTVPGGGTTGAFDATVIGQSSGGYHGSLLASFKLCAVDPYTVKDDGDLACNGDIRFFDPTRRTSCWSHAFSFDQHFVRCSRTVSVA
jgi:hypothetical protein